MYAIRSYYGPQVHRPFDGAVEEFGDDGKEERYLKPEPFAFGHVDAPGDDAENNEKRHFDLEDHLVTEHVHEPLYGVTEIFPKRITRFVHLLTAFTER